MRFVFKILPNLHRDGPVKPAFARLHLHVWVVHCDLGRERLGCGYTRSMAEIQRRKTPTVKIGHVRVGWEVPVVVQSMTNTDTADVAIHH